MRRLACCNFSLEYLAQCIEKQLCLPTIDVSRPVYTIVGTVCHRAAAHERIHVQERMFRHIGGKVREQSLVYNIPTFAGQEHGMHRQVQELPNLFDGAPTDVHPCSHDGDGTAVVFRRQRIYAPRTNLTERGIFGVPIALHLAAVLDMWERRVLITTPCQPAIHRCHDRALVDLVDGSLSPLSFFDSNMSVRPINCCFMKLSPEIIILRDLKHSFASADENT